MNNKNLKNNGYLIVASRKIQFYRAAINALEAIKDFYPEAKTCLVTEEKFLDGREEIADHLILCNDEYRAKLWGMARSPFSKTFYLDADVEVEHEDIATIFDQLDKHNKDIMFTELTADREYCYKSRYYGCVEFTLGGGVCLYDSSNPKVMEFMNDWHKYFNKQFYDKLWPDKNDQWVEDKSKWDLKRYPRDGLKMWDQFSLWWLVNRVDKYKDLRIGILEDDARWNYYSKYLDSKKHNKLPIVVRHYSSGMIKDDK